MLDLFNICEKFDLNLFIKKDCYFVQEQLNFRDVKLILSKQFILALLFHLFVKSFSLQNVLNFEFLLFQFPLNLLQEVHITFRHFQLCAKLR